MLGMLKLTESVTLPKAEYEALVAVAHQVLWASQGAVQVQFPGAHGYLVPAQAWEAAMASLACIVEPYAIKQAPETEDAA